MKILDILLESYDDAKRIFYDVYGRSRYLSGKSDDVIRVIVDSDVNNFSELVKGGLISREDRDISSWIGRARGIDSEVDANRFVMDFRDVIRRGEDRKPDYDVVLKNGDIEIIVLNNFASAKKLCSGMRVCIRSSESDFSDYSEDGVLFLILVDGRKYVYEYNAKTDGGTIWDSGNDEIDFEEFFNMHRIGSLTGYDVSDSVERDAMENLIDEWEGYKA